MILLRSSTSITLLLSLGLALGCGKKEEKEEDKNADTPTEITMSGTLALGTSLLFTANAITDYKLYCVTFEETPRAKSAEFGADGSFSIAVPSQVQIGCFVNDKTTNLPKFSFQFETGSDSKMGGSATTGVALKGNIDLGALTISEGKVVVPASKFAEQKSTIAGLDLDKIHNKQFTLKCLPTGSAELDAMCKEDLMDGKDSATVYFRVLKAKEGGADVLGLGIWASKAAFEGCGSIDMIDSEKAAMNDVEFTQAVTAAAYSADNDACPVRDEGNERNMEGLKNYYLMSKAAPTGAGYAVGNASREEHGGGCVTTHSTAVEFNGNETAMTGAFLMEEGRFNCTEEGGSEQIPVVTKIGAFNVSFTDPQ